MKKRRKIKKVKKFFNLYIVIATVVLSIVSINFIFQIAKKPAELLSALSMHNKKSPESTWSNYNYYFNKHSTKEMTPSFLAALAQIESAGNPLATPEWKFKWTGNILNFFAPASSSVGLFQFTDGTFRKAKKYCIQENKVIKDGPWNNPNTCWFNSLYLRTSASDSIEMTSAYLTLSLKKILSKQQLSIKRLVYKTAAIIHLCGIHRAKKYKKNGFKISQLNRCGTHSVFRYVKRVIRLEKRFSRLQKIN